MNKIKGDETVYHINEYLDVIISIHFTCHLKSKCLCGYSNSFCLPSMQFKMCILSMILMSDTATITYLVW